MSSVEQYNCIFGDSLADIIDMSDHFEGFLQQGFRAILVNVKGTVAIAHPAPVAMCLDDGLLHREQRPRQLLAQQGT